MVKLQISDIKLDISGLPGKEVIIEIYGLETKTSLDPELPIVFYPRYFPLVLMFSSLFAACLKIFFKLNYKSCFDLLFYKLSKLRGISD